MKDIIRQLDKNNEEHRTIMEKIDLFGEKIEALSIKIAELPEAIFKKTDEKYASKTVEKVMYAFIGIILTSFIIALWELVVK